MSADQTSSPKLHLSVNLGGLKMRNPVTTASGTFGSGREYAQFNNLNALGALTTKGVSATPWEGNPDPRIAETSSGMLNSIGLQNPGVEVFIERDLAFLSAYRVPVIVNVCGHSINEYVTVIEALESQKRVGAYEVNISCPNVDAGGLAFGCNTAAVEDVVGRCRAATKRPLIVKLSPNVTSIADIARAAEAAGADAVSLINTVLGMAIDARKRKPQLARVVGGLSGPAIKPIALRMVYEASRAVRIPVLGMGGITSGLDAIEFMLAGATAVAVGTASFRNPRAVTDCIAQMRRFCREEGVTDIRTLIGALTIPPRP